MSKKYDDFDNDEIEMMNLVLDDGTELECEILSIFPANNDTYIALYPLETPEGYDDNDVLLYKYKELENDEVELTAITDDDEFEIVADAFDEILDEMEFNSMPDNED
ncbi:MAG: DUF1292 domain-containing protein [Coprococcus sp.]